MNDAYSTPTNVDPDLLAEFNLGTAKAIGANRARETRELFLDSLYFHRATKGQCRTCRKWLPGNRTLCGRCAATNGRPS